MNSPAKFLFDTPLDAPSAPPPIPFDEVERLKASHAAELARVREQCLQEGRQQGREEAERSLEHELYRKLDRLVSDRLAWQGEIEAQLADTRRSSLLLAMTIARKLSGSLLDRYPDRHIENFFRDSLALLPEKSSLRLHVAPGLSGALQPRLQALLERNGQENALQIIEDETVDGVACRLSWLDGGVEQNPEMIYASIEKMIEASLYSDTARPPQTGEQADMATPPTPTVQNISADNNARQPS